MRRVSREVVTRSHFPGKNLANPECLPDFSADVHSANGQALFVTHGFYYIPLGETPTLNDLDEGELKKHMKQLALVTSGCQKHGIPVIMQQSVDEYRPYYYPSYQHLAEAKAENLLGIAPEKVYWTFTRIDNPIPIMRDDADAPYCDPHSQTESWVNILEQAGVIKACVAGQNLGGKRFGLSSNYYEPAETELAEHFIKTDRPKHPYTKIKPYGCVAATMKILASYSDKIEVIPTTATFPNTVPSQDQIVSAASRITPFRIEKK